MMRTHFRGNPYSGLLRRLYDLHRPFRGTVAQVQTHTGLTGQDRIPCGNHVLDRIGDAGKSQSLRLLVGVHHASLHHQDVLAVVADQAVPRGNSFHGRPHEGSIHDGLSILRKCFYPVIHEFIHGRKLTALHSPCNGGSLINVHPGEGRRSLFHVPHGFNAVRRGSRVRHGEQGCHTAAGSRCGTRSQFLFVCLARIPQMYMQVNQPRKNRQPAQIHHPVRVTRKILPYPGYPAVRNKHVGRSFKARSRVHNMSVFQQQSLFHPFHLTFSHHTTKPHTE